MQTPLIVRIVNAAVTSRSGTSKDGKAYASHTQQAHVENGGAYPEPCTIRHDRPEDAYPAGVYTVGAGSLRPSRQYPGSWDLGRMILVPAADAARALAAAHDALTRQGPKPVAA